MGRSGASGPFPKAPLHEPDELAGIERLRHVVGDAELETFLQDYDIGQAESFKGIAEGVENTNYFLQTEAGTYILTLYEKRVREADLPFFLALMDHLAARGLTCPQPVYNGKGEALGRLAGRHRNLMINEMRKGNDAGAAKIVSGLKEKS